MTGPYLRFGLILLASLAAMFAISLAQVRTLDHFYLNASNLYIAITGVGAMGLIMFVGMRRMFRDPRMNVGTVLVLSGVLAGGLFLARTETFVGNRGFLESMIPHHSRAILVCEESQISDAQIADLCRRIIDAQQREIDEMKQILTRY